jgi:ribulose-bisphosphate carboxylase small chain
MLERQEVQGRSIRYTTRGYAAEQPEAERYK